MKGQGEWHRRRHDPKAMEKKRMTAKDSDVHAMEDPERRLEQAMIDEYLRARALDATALHGLAK